ncbi:hypothetical protein BCR33DRAFT_721534 [Rhizoclosmatium globosum]|uniref:GATA-type domain-containing protein n=1 Tax=Rhizoclosmatium globosum TaxID=329046 RepID=A0A1Y2BRV7_9FUNG|nr:hypothetical protein BCR33DRAFT_721534 [Rhizoclosmatium globosum]|eukprot:ORY37491.1 hypothetical protein BCR33DRAFT_721534 [Rhizoclosmatium globosum]
MQVGGSLSGLGGGSLGGGGGGQGQSDIHTKYVQLLETRVAVTDRLRGEEARASQLAADVVSLVREVAGLRAALKAANVGSVSVQSATLSEAANAALSAQMMLPLHSTPSQSSLPQPPPPQLPPQSQQQQQTQQHQQMQVERLIPWPLAFQAKDKNKEPALSFHDSQFDFYEDFAGKFLSFRYGKDRAEKMKVSCQYPNKSECFAVPQSAVDEFIFAAKELVGVNQSHSSATSSTTVNTSVVAAANNNASTTRSTNKAAMNLPTSNSNSNLNSLNLSASNNFANNSFTPLPMTSSNPPGLSDSTGPSGPSTQSSHTTMAQFPQHQQKIAHSQQTHQYNNAGSNNVRGAFPPNKSTNATNEAHVQPIVSQYQQQPQNSQSQFHQTQQSQHQQQQTHQQQHLQQHQQQYLQQHMQPQQPPQQPPPQLPMQQRAPAQSQQQQRKSPSRIPEDRLCGHCGTRETPLWRSGPAGSHLCNACGVKWRRVRAREDQQNAAQQNEQDFQSPAEAVESATLGNPESQVQLQNQLSQIPGYGINGLHGPMDPALFSQMQYYPQLLHPQFQLQHQQMGVFPSQQQQQQFQLQQAHYHQQQQQFLNAAQQQPQYSMGSQSLIGSSQFGPVSHLQPQAPVPSAPAPATAPSQNTNPPVPQLQEPQLFQPATPLHLQNPQESITLPSVSTYNVPGPAMSTAASTPFTPASIPIVSESTPASAPSSLHHTQAHERIPQFDHANGGDERGSSPTHVAPPSRPSSMMSSTGGSTRLSMNMWNDVVPQEPSAVAVHTAEAEFGSGGGSVGASQQVGDSVNARDNEYDGVDDRIERDRGYDVSGASSGGGVLDGGWEGEYNGGGEENRGVTGEERVEEEERGVEVEPVVEEHEEREEVGTVEDESEEEVISKKTTRSRRGSAPPALTAPPATVSKRGGRRASIGGRTAAVKAKPVSKRGRKPSNTVGPKKKKQTSKYVDDDDEHEESDEDLEEDEEDDRHVNEDETEQEVETEVVSKRSRRASVGGDAAAKKRKGEEEKEKRVSTAGAQKKEKGRTVPDDFSDADVPAKRNTVQQQTSAPVPPATSSVGVSSVVGGSEKIVSPARVSTPTAVAGSGGGVVRPSIIFRTEQSPVRSISANTAVSPAGSVPMSMLPKTFTVAPPPPHGLVVPPPQLKLAALSAEHAVPPPQPMTKYTAILQSMMPEFRTAPRELRTVIKREVKEYLLSRVGGADHLALCIIKGNGKDIPNTYGVPERLRAEFREWAYGRLNIHFPGNRIAL